MSATLVTGGFGTNSLQYSSDQGTSWGVCGGPSSLVTNGTAIWGVAYGGGRWVAAGEGPDQTIAYSPDGITWNDTSGGLGGGGQYAAVAYGKDGTGNPLWVVTGYGSTPLLHSPDGETWSEASFSPIITFQGTGVAFGKDNTGANLWIAVGNDDINAIHIYSSPNGTSWTGVTTLGVSSGFAGIAYGNNIWVVGGSSNIYWSSNGVDWNPASVYPNTGGGGGGTYGIRYHNGIFVAVGYGVASIMWSTNGDTWTAATGTLFSNCGNSVTHDSLGWIAVGNSNTSNMLFSPDGKDWNATDRFVLTTDLYAISSTEQEGGVPCFVTGTQILTPTGYKPVEELQSGDYVLTAEKRRVPIKLFTFTIDCATEDTAPYRINAGTFGLKYPKRDLHLSARHAVKDDKGRWQIPKYLAKYYSKVKQYGVGESVTYYHIECPNFYRDNLVAEGLVVESYKNTQGTKGVVYMWSNSLGGWERLPAGKMTQVPKNPKNSVIISY